MTLSEAIKQGLPLEIVAYRNRYAILANGAYYLRSSTAGNAVVTHDSIEDAERAIEKMRKEVRGETK